MSTVEDIRWDNFNLVNEAIMNFDTIKLVVVLFAEKWNRFALRAALDFETIRKSNDALYAQIFIVDPETCPDKTFDYGVQSTPAVLFFWEGKPLTVRRIDWDDDIKYVGATSQEKWLNMIRFARETGENGKYTINVE